MNELTGKLVNVVLAVEDGKGMEYIKSPITLVANFNGRVLESDPASPEECPIFNTELVWEIEKKDLRKIRSSNVPLRIECFTTDLNARKIKVGFILLSLRSAYIVPKKDARQEVPFKWQRLNGVSHDIRSRHPELYLSLSIRDTLPDDLTIKTGDSSPFLADEVLELVKELEDTIPLKYLEDGFIQVGDGEVEAYYLDIVVKTAANLDVLLPENLVFNAAKDKYHLCFTLFGITIKSKPLRDLHDTLELNEKIVVSLLSRYEILQEFFSKYHQIQVCLYNGTDKLGATKISVEHLGQDSNPLEEWCYFHLPDDDTLVPESLNGRKPYIEVETSLEQRETPPSAGEARRVKTKTSSLIKIPVDATGDAKASTDSVLRSYVSPRQVYVPMLELEDEGEETLLDYNSFCLRLVVENISWKKQPKLREFQMQFGHPRADSTLCFKREVQNDQEQIVEGVEARLYFVSTKRKLKGLLYAWRPKLVITNARGSVISEVVKVESEVFALKEMNEHTQILLVRNLEEKEMLCEITIVMHLEELEQISGAKQGDLYPPILDERIVLLELNQLKTTKAKLLETYEKELDTLSKSHIEHLEQQWQKHKETIEQKLNRNVKKCTLLTKQLKTAAKNLQSRQQQLTTQHRSTLTDDNYNKFCNHQYLDLIEEISKLQFTNGQLQNVIEQQREELEANKKSALTKEQTTNLLQELRVLEEQFEEAQKQKSYFKEQWKKAVKEIHELRTEEQKQLLSEIEQNKQELSQLSLDCETFYESDVE